MYSVFEGNERHYVRIISIEDNSYMDKPNVILKCNGTIYQRDRLSETGVSTSKYSIRVKVFKDFLINFVLNELSTGDEIMIVGHSGMETVKGGFGIRITIAEEIYKADWEHYFTYPKTGEGVKWKDWS